MDRRLGGKKIIVYLCFDTSLCFMEEFDLRRIRLGDTEAFRPFFDHYTLVLRRFALKYLHDIDTVKDIVQDSMVKFWDRRTRFPNLYAATSFLFITTRNSLLDELRHRKVITDYQQFMVQWGGEINQDFIQLYEEETVRTVYLRLEEEIARLPNRTQEVIRLQLAGYRTREIAELLGIGKESVKTLKRYGLEKLRGTMDGYEYIWNVHSSDFSS